MTCDGICKQYRIKPSKGRGHYKKGHKRCQLCEIFIKYDGLRCPCCGKKLRLGSHVKRLKKIKESYSS